MLASFSGQNRDGGANKGQISKEDIEEFKQSIVLASFRPDHRLTQY